MLIGGIRGKKGSLSEDGGFCAHKPAFEGVDGLDGYGGHPGYGNPFGYDYGGNLGYGGFPGAGDGLGYADRAFRK